MDKEKNREEEKEEINETESKVDKNISQNSKSGNLIFFPLLVSVFLSILFGGLAGFLAGGSLSDEVSKYSNEDRGQNESGLGNENGVENSSDQINAKQESQDVVSAVKKASPAVVSIIVTKDVPKLDSFFGDPFSSDPFFNPFGFRQRQQEPETEKREIGGGTGFIIDKEGYIITNRHVVSDEEAEYTVMTNEGEKMQAEVLARDQFLDIAFLKVKPKDTLPVLKLGDSERLDIGETVIAIGNSLGEFRNTVSKGIVSGLKRNIEAGSRYGQSEVLEEVIQTDAAINPGNSGGPLLNLNGEVVGVNVAMAQGAENIGFSIPVNQIKDIYQGVKTKGKIVRPYLGVRYILINDQIQEANNLSVDYGALILRGEEMSHLAVVPGSPADKAGLEENDIILEVDGKKITEERGLAEVIRDKKVGEKARLKVLKDGEEKEVEVELEESDL
ncbi:MAG: trypsin-like peptidase domain-containing protein [Candidatus Moraniibacteriota bacterium]